MKYTWLGHAAFLLEGADATVLIDPFLSGNPSSAPLPEETRPTVILVTHGHHDHLGDAVDLSIRFEVPVVAIPELSSYLTDSGATSERVNYGGRIDVGGVTVRCVPAIHTSSVGPERGPAGAPCGFVATVDNVSVYHAGDTCVFGDMELIREQQQVDLALLPIGGRFTMDPVDAIRAVQLIRPRVVTPMHYNTFPPIAQDPAKFADEVRARTTAEPVILAPGEASEVGSG